MAHFIRHFQYDEFEEYYDYEKESIAATQAFSLGEEILSDEEFDDLPF